MSKFKNLAFRLIKNIEEKKESKEQKDLVENLSQPNDDKKPKKVNVKKIVILSSIIAVIAIIIGVTVGLSNRPVSYQINTFQSIEVQKDPQNNDIKMVFKTENNSSGYSVNLSNGFIKAYYSGTSSKFKVFLRSPQSTLPITINVSKSPNNLWTIGNIYYDMTNPNNTIAPSIILPTQQADKDISIPKLNSFLGNIETSSGIEPAGFNWMALLSILLPIATTLLLFWFISSAMRKQMGGMDLFSQKNNIQNTKSKVKFSDVAGIAEVKEELLEIVDYIRKPSKYASMGARSPKGLILYGPPGTGKTLIAKAVAGEANCNFFPMSGSSFEDMLVGVGAKRVRELFAKARKEAPSIIFIDEIDSVAAKRGKNDLIGGGGGVADQTINQLLAEMDGFSTESGVTVIAATNRLDVLDEAILRPGRFDRQIRVNLPDISEREEILKIHTRNKNISSKVKLLEVARRTPGFSGAQLENILNEATLLAVREDKNVVTMSHLDEAIDRTIGGPKRKIRVMTEQEKEQIAYHEAGHALVGLHSDSDEIVQKITIIPRGNAAGYTLQTPREQEKQINTKKDLLNLVRMTLGGRAAEEVIYGNDMISTGAANDFYKVTNIVRSMVAQLGMTELGLTQFIPTEGTQTGKQFSEYTSKLIDEKIEEIISIEYNKAKEIITKNKVELDLIVKTLLLLETIVKEQIDYIHEKLELPKEAIEAQERILELEKEKSTKSEEDETKK